MLTPSPNPPLQPWMCGGLYKCNGSLPAFLGMPQRALVAASEHHDEAP